MTTTAPIRRIQLSSKSRNKFSSFLIAHFVFFWLPTNFKCYVKASVTYIISTDISNEVMRGRLNAQLYSKFYSPSKRKNDDRAIPCPRYDSKQIGGWLRKQCWKVQFLHDFGSLSLSHGFNGTTFHAKLERLVWIKWSPPETASFWKAIYSHKFMNGICYKKKHHAVCTMPPSAFL